MLVVSVVMLFVPCLGTDCDIKTIDINGKKIRLVIGYANDIAIGTLLL